MTTFLTPSPKQQFFTAAGVPLVGGKVYTYAAGTSTPLATYQDSTGTVSNTNPIILDSRGECNLWLLPANAYKFILKDSTDALIWTVDNINLGINFSNVIITGGSINGVTIGNITPGTAVFTDLTATGTVTFNSVTQMQIPAGPTANRSTTPVDGMIRYNNTTDIYEGNSTVAGETISTLQLSGTVTAVLTTTTPHGLSTGDYITVSGATPAAYNSSYNITYISSTSFSYTMASNPGGNATVVGTYEVHAWSAIGASSAVTTDNRIINGDFYVAQRATSATLTAGGTIANGYATVDRFYGYCTGANVTMAQVSGTGNNRNLLQFTGAASVTAIGCGQRIESLNSYDLAGQTVTLSAFIANSLLTSVTWTAYYANTTDTFGTLASPTRTQIATGTFTVTSGLTQYSAQIAIPSAATTGIEIVFTVGAQTSGTWQLDKVQLEIGSVATDFKYENYTLTLSKCQRYYAVTSTAIAGGLSSVNGAGNVQWFYKSTMRIAPQVTGNTATTSVTSTADFAAGVTNNNAGYFATFNSGSTASAEL